MRSTYGKHIGAGVITALLLAVSSGSVVAHDESCELELRDAPIEDVPAPPGWVWRELEIASDGWQGRVEWAGGDIRAASFTITCAADPAGLFERRAQVRRAFRSDELELETLIGDETVAWYSATTATTHLEWRSNSRVGDIVGEWNANIAELEAMAVAFEAASSSGGATASD